MKNSVHRFRRCAGLFLATVLALLIHGYHPYAEDAEIYLPGVIKILHPGLFPFNAQFFNEHAAHSFYPNLIAASVKITHLPLAWVAVIWQLASTLLLLAASLRLASTLFEAESARWGATALMAALLTLPVAGTDLYILDQYLNPRNLAAFSAIFAVAAVLNRRFVAAVLWLTFAGGLHPLSSSLRIF